MTNELRTTIVDEASVPTAPEPALSTEVGQPEERSLAREASSETPVDPVSRRGMLGKAGAMAAGLATGTLVMTRRATAQGGGGPAPVLVNIDLGGGADGLTLCAPYADAGYQSVRGALAIPAPTSGNGVKDLNGYFGLPPGMAPLHQIYLNGDLAVVHGTGLWIKNQSHFDAQHELQTGNQLGAGAPDQNGIYGRHLTKVPGGGSVLRGMDQASVMHRCLVGAPKGLAIKSPPDHDIAGDPFTVQLRKLALDYIFQQADQPLKDAAIDSLATVDLLNSVTYGSTGYPGSPFGTAMSHVAKLVLAKTNIEVYTITKGGWDLHADFGALGPLGTMHLLMLDLASSIRAFYDEVALDPTAPQYTLVVSTEFGRRIPPNSGAGVDHGHGQAMFVVGNGTIHGGQVYTNGWTNLSSMTDTDGDLKVTIDYRDVLSEMLVDHAGLPVADVPNVFPGYVPGPSLNIFV